MNIADNFFLDSLDAIIRGVDFLKCFFWFEISTKYRKVIINGILNHIIKPTLINT